MLTIREEQLRAFRKVEVQKFVDQAAIHVGKFFPKQCRELGHDKLRELIRDGIQTGSRYGITGKADVLKYIDLTVLFGRDFDVNPELPWAAETLKSENRPNDKIESLMFQARKHLRKL
jgi:hypothetical protein